MKLEYTPIVLNGNVVKNNKKFVIHAIRKGALNVTFCRVDLAYEPFPVPDRPVTCERCLSSIRSQEKAIKTIEKMKNG